MLRKIMIFILVTWTVTSLASAKIKVVTTFSDLAAIVKEIGADLVEVDYLSYGDQDPHFVTPKPSLVIKLKAADLLVTTGMDLEMWIATLQDKARNDKITDGAVGFVTACTGLDILEKPISLSRDQGDVHISGNPHFHTSPLNWPQISENILIGLKKVDAKNAEIYAANQTAFVEKVWKATFGDKLVEMFGGEQLKELLRAGTLFEFLDNEYQGNKLVDLLDGWMKTALPFRGKEMVAYHKNWSYFARDFGLSIIGFIEPKPGIPPTPKHVEETIRLIKDRGVDIMLVASYFERRKPTTIAQKTDIRALFLPLSVDAIPEASDNFKLVDYWIAQINSALINPAKSM